MGVGCLSRSKQRARGACLLVLAAAVAVAGSSGHAQTPTTLVSNAEETLEQGSRKIVGQRFTTGRHANGYALSSIDIHVSAAGSSSPTVSLHADIVTNNQGDVQSRPSGLIATLQNPSTIRAGALNTFTLPAWTLLRPNTRYWVVADGQAAPNPYRWSLTQSNAQTTVDSDWDLQNICVFKNTRGDYWATTSSAAVIAVRGAAVSADATDMTAPALDADTPPAVEGDTLVLTYDEYLDRGSRPAPGAFTVTVAGTERAVTGVDVFGREVTLTLASAVDVGEAVTLGYAVPDTDPLQDVSGNEAAALTGRTVTNDTRLSITRVAVTSAPRAATDTYGAGEEIEVTVTFSHPVRVSAGRPHLQFSLGPFGNVAIKQAAYDRGSGSAALVFAYTVQATDADPDGIGIQLNSVKLDRGEYIRGVAGGLDAVLTHAAPGRLSAHKVDGGLTPPANAAPIFSPATAARSVAENSAAGSDVGAALPAATDADGDSLTYTLEGTDAVSFAFDAATRQLSTRAGVAYDHEARRFYSLTVTADDGKGGTAALAVSVTVTDAPEPPAAPAAPAVGATPGSTTGIEASWTAPDNAGRPPIEGYDLRYRLAGAASWEDGPRDVTGTAARIAGLAAGSAYQVQVRASNDEGDGPWSASGEGTTNSADNAAPVFSPATATRTVAENSPAGTDIGAALPAATDADGDSLTYTLQGADAASFSFDASTRQLATRAGVAYDHEAKASLSMTMRADDGNGGTATLALTVNVVDAAEPPAAPRAPGVRASPESATRLDVSWTAPDNAGRPPIGGYDLRYRAGGAASWRDGPRGVAGTRAGIAGLAEDTRYRVQVRASNAEGDGPWSASGLGATTSAAEAASADPVPGAWLARFGRSIASQAVEAIGGRLEGDGAARVILGGREVHLAPWPPPGSRPPGVSDAPAGASRTMGGREVLLGSSFRLSLKDEPGPSALTAWGEFATGGFDAEADGIRMDGSVTSGFFAADVERKSWLLGIALGSSQGSGEYAHAGPDTHGRLESGLIAVYPYARLELNERLRLWGLAGLGEGELRMTRARRGGAARRRREDISMRMGALGARGGLVRPDTPHGLALALSSDAAWLRAGSDAARANVLRLRFAVEGSRGFRAGAGRLTPSLSLALRHDGGDAETGTGVELGAGLRFVYRALSVRGAARALIARGAAGHGEWGAAGAIRIAAGASGRGLSFALAPSWGAAPGRARRPWPAADARGFAPGRSLGAELAYGLALGRPPGLVTPYAGLSLPAAGGQSWRAGARWTIAPGTALRVETAHARPAAGKPPDTAITLRFKTTL